MATSIRADPAINGIKIPGEKERESKLAQYADDTTLLLADDRSVTNAFRTVEAYQQASGGRLNMKKTEGMYVGKQQGKTHGPVKIKWREDQLEILGTTISRDMHQDWEKPLGKLEKTLQLWSSRALSIRGRALIARTYGLATIVYLATCFVVPIDVSERAMTAIYRFIWQKGTEYVSRATVQQPTKDGGLNVPDLQLVSHTIKAKWALRATDEATTTDWALWTRYNIGMVLTTLNQEWTFLRRNDRPRLDGTSLPPWYSETSQFIRTRREDIRSLLECGTNITTKALRLLGERAELRADQKWHDHGVTKDLVEAQWENTWKGLNNAHEQDLRWRALHWSLPTRDRLARWRGMQIPANCPFCPNTETMAHMFYECRRLRHLWDSVNAMLRKLTFEPVTNFQETLIFTRPTEKYILKEYLVTCANYVTWISRVKKSKENLDTPDLMPDLVQRIKQRINIDVANNKTRRVEEIWGYQRVLIDTSGPTIEHSI